MSSRPQPTKDGPMGPRPTTPDGQDESAYPHTASVAPEAGAAREASIGPADAKAKPKRKSERAKPGDVADRRAADRNPQDPFAPDGEPRPSRFHVPG